MSRATPPAQEAAVTQQPAPSAVPLTDEQIAALHDSLFPTPFEGHGNVVKFSRALLALAAPIAPEPAQPQAAGVEDMEVYDAIAKNYLAPKQAAASPEIDALVEAILAASSALGDQRIMAARGSASQDDVAEAYMALQDTIRPLAAAARQAPTGADAVDAERWQWLRAEHLRHDPLCHLSWKRNSDRNGSEWVNTADLDAAVDAARKAQPTRGEA